MIQLLFISLLLFSNTCGFGLDSFGENDLFQSIENAFVHPRVVVAKGSDDRGNSWYSRDYEVNGVAYKQPAADFFELLNRQLLDNEQRQVLFAESRPNQPLSSSLKTENSLIEDLLSAAIAPSQQSQAGPMQIDFNDPLRIIEKKMRVRFRPIPGLHYDAVFEQTHKQPESSKHIGPQEEKEVQEVLDEILGEHVRAEASSSERSKAIENLKEQVATKERQFIDTFIKSDDKQKKSFSNDDTNNGLSDKQMMVLNTFADYEKNGHYGVIDTSSVFIEFDHEISLAQADDLLLFISDIIHVPRSVLKDLRVKKNLALFKVNSEKVNATVIANTIYSRRSTIEETKKLKIVSCGIGKDGGKASFEKYLLSINPKSELFFIITIVSCVSAALILAILLVVFLIRRKTHLQQKLASDVGLSKGIFKKKLDDEELLIRGDKRQSSWLSYLPFIRRSDRCHAKNEMSPSQNYQDLCRERMQTKGGAKNTSLNTAICTDSSEISTPGLVTPSMANGSNAINSTPIRVTNSVGSDGKSDSSRSSTSS